MTKVLVVDDYFDGLDMLVIVLEANGFDARGALPRDKPLDIVRDWQPDVLLTDLNMPGLPGSELAREALRLRPGLRRACLSGVSDDLLADAKADGHFEAVFRKPVDIDALSAWLAQ